MDPSSLSTGVRAKGCALISVDFHNGGIENPIDPLVTRSLEWGR